MKAPRPQHFIAAAIWAVTIAVGVCFGFLLQLPNGDFPNHVARADIISHLWAGDSHHLAETYKFTAQWSPYILCDLVLAFVMQFIGFETVGAWAFAIVVVALPLAVLQVLRAAEIPHEQRPLLLAVSALGSTNWFFLNGFFSFQVGLCLSMFAVATLLRSWEHGGRWRIVLFAVQVTLVYLAHLAAFVVLGVFVGTFVAHSFMLRRLSMQRAITLLLPFAINAIVHVVNAVGQSLGEDHWRWRTVVGKILGLASPAIRYHYALDVLLFALASAALIFAVIDSVSHAGELRRRIWRDPFAIGSGAALLLYFSLPLEALHAWDVDNRALPFAYLLLPIAAIRIMGIHDRKIRPVAWLGLSIALINAALVLPPVIRANAQSALHRLIGCDRLGGKRVLPVETLEPEGRIRPLLHAGALLEVDCSSTTPYLFRRDAAMPVPFFEKKERWAYVPDQFWYVRGGKLAADSIVEQFDFLLVTKPFDKHRLENVPLAPVRENSAVALFRVLKK